MAARNRRWRVSVSASTAPAVLSAMCRKRRSRVSALPSSLAVDTARERRLMKPEPSRVLSSAGLDLASLVVDRLEEHLPGRRRPLLRVGGPGDRGWQAKFLTES